MITGPNGASGVVQAISTFFFFIVLLILTSIFR